MFVLQANDILYIPDNKGQRLTNTIIERIVGFGTATGTGILVWHYEVVSQKEVKRASDERT